MEIERKFVVESPPDLGALEGDEIEQGYLALADASGGAEVRLRRRGEETVLTIKSAGTRARVEEEFELDPQRFASLWPLTEGRRLRKVRYVLAHGDLQIELDVYGGELDGLVVAEVEFEDQNGADAFEPPSWFGDEVTTNSAFRNATLATEGMPA
jgi:CYTH domain-containing protein